MAAQTVAQLNLLATESMLSGVVDEVINLDPVIRAIPFEPLQGTQRTWVRESTVPNAAFFEADEVLASGSPTFAQVTLAIKQVGLNSDLPGIYRVKENVNEQRAINVQKTMKGVMEYVGDKLIYGNATTSAREFDGLHALTPSAQNTAEGSGTTGSALNISNLDLSIDLVRNGDVETIIMNRNVRRRMSAWVNTSSTNTPIQIEKDALGVPVMLYQGYRFERSDRITMTETVASGTFSAKTGGDTTSLFGMQFGAPDTARPGIFGISGPTGPELIQMGYLEDKDVIRDRIVWYLACGLGSTKSIFRIDGVLDTAVAA